MTWSPNEPSTPTKLRAGSIDADELLASSFSIDLASSLHMDGRFIGKTAPVWAGNFSPELVKATIPLK